MTSWNLHMMSNLLPDSEKIDTPILVSQNDDMIHNLIDEEAISRAVRCK